MQDYEYNYEEGYDLNGGTVHVSSACIIERTVVWDRGSGHESYEHVYGFQYTNDIGQPSSMTDFTQYLKSGSIAQSTFLYVYNDIVGSPVSESYYSTDEYAAKKALVEQYVGWVVGDADHPGVAIFRNSEYNNRITMWICYGYGERTDIDVDEDDDDPANKGYKIGYLGDYDYAQMQQVFLTWDAKAKEQLDIYGNPQKAIKMHYSTNTSGNYGFAKFAWGSDVTEQAVYDATIATTFSVFTRLNTVYRSGLLNYNPVYPDEIAWGSIGTRDWFNLNDDFSNFSRIGDSAIDDAEIDPEDEPYANAGDPGDGGGNGGYPDTSDENDIPDPTGLPSMVSTGLVKLYNPTSAQMQDFTDFLFSGITESIENTIKKLTTEPLQYVIGMYLTRFTPTTSTTQHIKFAGVDTEVSSAVIANQWQQLNCGYLDVPNASKTHLDYSPYSSAIIFLPYVGYRELNIDEIMGSRLLVKYNIDLVTGACVAYVHVNRIKRTQGDAKIDSVIYEFPGNCFVQCPLSSKDSAGVLSALSSFAGAIGAAATHNVAGAVSGAVNAIATEKIGVNRNGSPSANYGYMGIQHPFLILQRPLDKVPQKFASYEGWTSHQYKKIGDMRGYTEIDPDTLWTDGFSTATTEEIELIKSITSSGFYIN